MIARYRNQLLAKTFLAWAAKVRLDAQQRAKSSARAMALMSGKAELLLQVYFQQWQEEVQYVVERRAELALKMVSRYQNGLLTRVFLVWAAEPVHDERKLLIMKAWTAILFSCFVLSLYSVKKCLIHSM